jgi:sensitive to high expression protein 9
LERHDPSQQYLGDIRSNGSEYFLVTGQLGHFRTLEKAKDCQRDQDRSGREDGAGTIAAPVAQAEVDEVVEPVKQPLEKIEEHVVDTIEAAATEIMPEPAVEVAPDAQPEAMADSGVTVGETPLAAGEILPEEAVEVSDSVAEIDEPVEKAVEEPIQRPEAENWEERLALWKETIYAKLTLYKAKLQDLFSERQVTVKRIDVTTIALEGAAVGVAVVGLVWALLTARS